MAIQENAFALFQIPSHLLFFIVFQCCNRVLYTFTHDFILGFPPLHLHLHILPQFTFLPFITAFGTLLSRPKKSTFTILHFCQVVFTLVLSSVHSEKRCLFNVL